MNNLQPKTVTELADTLGCSLLGSRSTQALKVAEIGAETRETILFLKKPKEPADLQGDSPICIIPADKKELAASLPADKSVLLSQNPTADFIKLLNIFNPYTQFDSQNFAGKIPCDEVKSGGDLMIGPETVIKQGTEIGQGACLIGSNYVGRNAKIGKRVILHPGAAVLDGCEVGDDTIIHANTVIGSDGFGYEQIDGQVVKIPQIGNVVIGCSCEIGSNTSIDRATIGTTRIGNSVKIDNLVQISHNCTIGDQTIIAGCSAIAGSSVIGKGVVIAGRVSISDHCQVGDQAVLAAHATMMSGKALQGKGPFFGQPLRPIREELKLMGFYGRLPELFSRIKALEKELEEKKGS